MEKQVKHEAYFLSLLHNKHLISTDSLTSKVEAKNVTARFCILITDTKYMQLMITSRQCKESKYMRQINRLRTGMYLLNQQP